MLIGCYLNELNEIKFISNIVVSFYFYYMYFFVIF